MVAAGQRERAARLRTFLRPVRAASPAGARRARARPRALLPTPLPAPHQPPSDEHAQ